MSTAAGLHVLSREALAFVERLQRELNPERERLLGLRRERGGERPRFVGTPEEFVVAPPPPDLVDRRVEIMGPVERKMLINALNSGAEVFMADFKDACSPTWGNVVEGRRNVHDAVRAEAKDVFARVALADELAEFTTFVAYDRLP